MDPKQRAPIAVLAAVAGATLFCSKVLLIKAAYGYDITPVSLLALRMLWALPFYIAVLAYDALRKGGRCAPGEVAASMGIGLLGYYLASLLDFLAIQYISPSLERMIQQLYPTFVLLIGAAFLGRRISRMAVVATVVGYSGILLMLREEFALAGPGGNPALGAMLVAAAAFSFAVYVVAGEDLMKRIGSRRFTSFAMVSGGAGVLTHYFVKEGLAIPTAPQEVIGISAMLAIFCTVIPSYLMAYAIQQLGGHATGMLSFIGVGITFVLSAVLLGEAFPSVKVLGIGLTLIGAGMAIRAGKRDRESRTLAPAVAKVSAAPRPAPR